jgi:predicted O-linked N-acetylglucosamine transferase (SPINDLY family)
MAELFERHDRSRFEVTLYSHGPSDGSAMRARIEAASERFADVQLLSDLEIAQRVRDDEIDVLVDLKGHTANNRLAVFAYRAAPVQASYLGFPGTSGAAWIDYIIGDPIVTPLEHAPHYSEQIAQLPGCYQPNDRQRALPTPPPRAACGLPDDALVLCGFNQPYKISSEVFDVWCDLLRALPHAVLWLLRWNGQAPERLRAEAQRRGVAASRLVWAPRVKPVDHMARLQLADVLIDTWPCNAHTTASDALWAGVPVVTLTGQTFASRVASSVLHAVALAELACPDRATYCERVLEIARDSPRREALRDHLAQARQRAPLFDSERRVRDLEALYARMWERHSAGIPPAALPALAR